MIWRLAGALITLGVVGQFFLNCEGANHFQTQNASSTYEPQPPTENSTAADNPVVLDCEDLESTFAETYHPFFTEKSCDRCHAPDKIPSIPGFAQKDISSAYLIFRSVGLDAIEGKLEGGHQGYVFEDLKDQLLTLGDDWQQAEQEFEICQNSKNENTESIGITTSEHDPEFHPIENDPFKCGLNHDVHSEKLGWQTLSWDLGQFKPSLTGVLFKIDVILEAIEFGVAPNTFHCPTGYRVRNPRLSTAESPVFLRSIKVRLNGEDQGVQTFSGIEMTVEAEQEDYELDPHGASTPFEVDRFVSGDTWSIVVEQIFKTR